MVDALMHRRFGEFNSYPTVSECRHSVHSLERWDQLLTVKEAGKLRIGCLR
jgi:hypothetical protein